MRSKYFKYVIVAATIILLLPLYYLFSIASSLKLQPGTTTTLWVQSQNGNDDGALLNLKSSGPNNAKLKYVVEKYAEIGIIALPDVNTIFSSLHAAVKIRDIATAPFVAGLTIIDLNKTSYMDGVIKYWKVISKEDDNEVRIAVFRHDEAQKKYQLVNSSPARKAHKGLNIFFEEIPITIKRNDILGLQTKKAIASNRVVLNEMVSVLSRSGFQHSLDDSNMVEDAFRGGRKGSYSFSALLAAGKDHGIISGVNDGETVLQLPLNPVYGHLSWYKFTFASDAGVFSLKPGLASILLNADPYIGLIQANLTPWSPKAFSVTLFSMLSLLIACTVWLISPETKVPQWVPIATQPLGIAGILIIFGLMRFFASSFPGFQFVVVVAAFIMVFILPGIITSRYYPRYGTETASGRLLLAFAGSLVFWLLPAFGLFLVKASYWPVIMAAIILLVLAFLKQPGGQKREATDLELGPCWKSFQFVLWGFVGLLVVHTLFSSRFHAEIFDSFHHYSLASKNFTLPIVGNIHPNLYGVTMRTVAPYAYNLWGLLVGMVVKISGIDIGTVYCVGNSLLVLLTFITQWWLLGFFVNSVKIKISAFAIIIVIYVTRTLATFAVGFQSSEFNFIMYGPAVHEFVLYAVYIIMGIQFIQSRQVDDLYMLFGLSLAMAFFHLEFIFMNSLVLFLLIFLSLRVNGMIRFRRIHVYLLAAIALLGTAGFIIKANLALGHIADSSSGWHNLYYGLRYEDKAILQRFYYIFKDLLKVLNSYIWYAVAIWGGMILVIISNKDIAIRKFKTAYFVVVLMLLISYNPISEMIVTPLMTSWPLKRIEIYLRSIMFAFAAIFLSVSLSYVYSLTKKYLSNLGKLVYAVPVILLFVPLLTHKQWLPQMKSTVSAVTYNQGNFLDISYLANLSELKFLNIYSKGRQVVVLVERFYCYAIPSLSHTYSYYHEHYPQYQSKQIEDNYSEREHIWRMCLNAEKNCSLNLPTGSLMLVRNTDVSNYYKFGYEQLYRGRLFTIMKV